MVRQALSVVAATWIGCVLAGGSLTRAEDPAKKKDGNQEPSKALTDQEFFRKATECELAEINLGRMASSRASRDEVKEFGRQMVEDHGKSLNDLLALGLKKNWEPARMAGDKSREMAERLATLEGAEFDREYVKAMVHGHKEAVRMYETQAKHGQDEDLKAHAARTLPVIQKHLQRAQALAGEKEGGAEPQKEKEKKDGNTPDKPTTPDKR